MSKDHLVSSKVLFVITCQGHITKVADRSQYLQGRWSQLGFICLLCVCCCAMCCHSPALASPPAMASLLALASLPAIAFHVLASPPSSPTRGFTEEDSISQLAKREQYKPLLTELSTRACQECKQKSF